MTLVELMVGLALTGLMAAAGYGAFAGVLDARARARADAAGAERAAALRETVAGWLASGTVLLVQGPRPGAPSARAAGAVPNAGANGGSDGDDLTLSTAAPTPAETPLATIRLFVADDAPLAGRTPPVRGLAVEYRPRVSDSLRVRELAPEVRALRVEYLDGRTRRWVRAAAAESTAVPVAVRLWLLGAPGAPLAPVLTLPFVRALGDPADGPPVLGAR